MNTAKKAGLLSTFALAFAGAVGLANVAGAQGSTSYEVVAVDHTGSGVVNLPDRELPPPGPLRTAAERWVRPLASDKVQYTVLLRDERGNYAQCTGLRLDLQPAVDRLWYKNLKIDVVAFDTQALRLLRNDPAAPRWPVRVGGCIPLKPEETQQLRTGQIGLTYGPNVERLFDYQTYTPETPAEALRRQDMIARGRNISTRLQADQCPSAGWNQQVADAKPGDRISLPGLCVR